MKQDSKPEIHLKFYASLKLQAGADEAVCRASTVRGALAFLKKNYSADFNKTLSSCHIYLNQDNVAFFKGASTRLNNGDTLHFLPPTGGG